MSDSLNNPVMQQPQRAVSKNAALGIVKAMMAMAGKPTQSSYGGVRNGKHNGRNAGAFGRRKP